MLNSEAILNLILSQYYNATTEEDILTYDERNGRFLTRGIVLPPEQSQQIIEDAEALHNNLLFQMLLKEVEYDGTRRMALKAGDWDAVRFPKANLYVANLLRKKVEALRNLQVPKQEPKSKPKK